MKWDSNAKKYVYPDDDEKGTWRPTTFSISGTKGHKIKVVNRSNVDITANVKFTPIGDKYTEITGSIHENYAPEAASDANVVKYTRLIGKKNNDTISAVSETLDNTFALKNAVVGDSYTSEKEVYLNLFNKTVICFIISDIISR